MKSSAKPCMVFHGRLEGISIRTSFAPNLPPVNVDREQFQRVVVNLVDNAAEAMQDALVKTLYIATQPGAAETVEVVVADSGAGVSSDDKEKLFLPYFSTKNRGTGLGLAIVNHIVAEHNGTIRVEDNQPVGARFTVELPAVLENEAAAAAGRGREGFRGETMKARRVLVVDDEPGIRQSLSGVLEDEGYAVETAESGEACLAVAARRRLRTRAAGHLAARHGRHGSAVAHSGDSVRRTAGGGGDQRSRLD